MVLAVVMPLLTLSCTEGGYADDREVTLAFSADTVAFDTLFTTVGSTTHQVVVYNRSGSDVVLSTVTLAGGRSSRFRLNVDGDTSLVVRNVEILDGDSIFIFIQANISPDDQTAPFLASSQV